MHKGNWLEHFKNQCQILEDQYKTQAPQNTSILTYALNEGYISIEEYLRWAKERYQIPVLKSDFFDAHAPSTELWKKYMMEFNWSPEILPIGIWDGHILVACLELPASFPVSLNPIFVLADFRQMQALWKKWHSQESVSKIQTQETENVLSLVEIAPATPTPAVPAAAQAAIVTPAPEPAPLTASISPEPKVASLKSAAQSEELVLIDDQELVLDGEKSTEDSESGENSESPETPQELEAPTGLTLHSAATSTRTILVKDEPALASKNEVQDTQAKIQGQTKTAIVNPIDSSQLAETLTLTIQDIDGTLKEAPTSPSVTAKSGTPSGLSFDKNLKGNNYLLNLLFDKHQKEFANEIKNVFTKMHSYFEKCMILTLDVHEEKLRPYFWDETFISNATHTDDISLNHPSFFKIVFVSQKPYHGYIVPNDINEKFFDEWNQGSLPSHVTMTPLIINNRIVGVLMGQGEKASYTWSVLKFMENLTSDLNRKLSEIIETAAA